MAEKRVAIVQSNYIPWKGYFDLIRSVDEFIVLDDVQYTRRDWRNRNRIKTKDGLHWLTIPVDVKGKYLQKICDTQIADPGWASIHWETIRSSYARARFFAMYEHRFAELYRGCFDTYLSVINVRFLRAICEMLAITTKIAMSSDYAIVEGKTDRLLCLCNQAGATQYLSGPAARAYLDEEQFASEGIAVQYADYSGYPEYPQLFPPFEHAVSVIDLIFNTGPDAVRYMKQV